MGKNQRDFLLEINVEELPVSYVRPALRQLQEAFLKEFKTNRIVCGRLYLAGTKNSLICYIKDVAIKQEEFSKEILGPSKSAGFDEEAMPTKQAIGFARSQGVKVEDLKIKTTPKGEYIVAVKKEKAQFTKDILSKIAPEIIKNLHFPKTMRWDESGLCFARPIESIASLFGRENINIKIGNVSQKRFAVLSPLEYLKRIQRQFLIDPDKRKAGIKKQLLIALGRLKSDLYVDELLLEEITFMVNSPYVFVGEFDEKFLSLPEDVLRASMSKYQRLLPVSKNNRLVNKFIAVIEGNKRGIKAVKRNYENILDARLKDSLFFFQEDTDRPLSEYTPQLKALIFQKDLGNMFEKFERLKILCGFICDKLNLESSLKNDTERAAQLSKADLVTHMVGEFPSLQGVMGMEYALKSREKKEVALAIKEHYLPKGMNGKLPVTLQGGVLAICDRIDNVVGFIGVGLDISGSFDPFGIRRNVQGLLQIIKDRSFRFGIDELIQKAIELYGNRLSVPPEKLKDKITGYIKERIKFLSGDIEKIGLKEAVLEVKSFDIVDIFKRIKDISDISGQGYFLEAAKVIERTGNILKCVVDEKIGDPDQGLFREDLERKVWQAYLDNKDRIQSLIDKGEYKEATKEYGRAFFKVLHDFFDKVLVNSEDRALRLNRLAIMKAINRLYTERVADLTKLPQIVVE